MDGVNDIGAAIVVVRRGRLARHTALDWKRRERADVVRVVGLDHAEHGIAIVVEVDSTGARAPLRMTQGTQPTDRRGASSYTPGDRESTTLSREPR